MAIRPIAILGAGSWGTALAILLARQGRTGTVLWARDAATAEGLHKTRQHPRYLPAATLPAALRVTADLDTVLADYPDLVLAVPSAGFQALLQHLGKLAASSRVLWATKGLAPGSGRLLSEVFVDYLPDTPHGVLSGPSFANEVAAGLPTAVTVASNDPAFATDMARVFSGPGFRVYTSTDLIGVQLGGAVKNVLAIAAGIADGLGLGANARAGLITRGLAELMRLGEALGARRETLVGLSGLGDLVLTCTDDQSRNRRLGLALGRGESLSIAKERIGQAVEGAETARVVCQAAARVGIEMPICTAVHAILFADLPPAAAVVELLGRALKAEVT